MTQGTLEGFPLSPRQKRLWHGSGGAVKRAWAAVAIDGPLDRSALEAAAARVIGRHQLLRTRFQRLEWMKEPLLVAGGLSEGPVIERLEGEVFRFGQGLAGGMTEEGIERLLGTKLELDDNPGAKLYLVASGPGRHLLVVSLPGLAADERTLDNIVEQIAEAYGRGSGEADAPRTLQYVQFAQWHDKLLASPQGEPKRAFWKRFDLAGAAAQTLPRELANGVTSDLRHLWRPLPGELVRSLGELATRHGVSLPEVGFCCYQILLARLMGKAPIVGHRFEGRRAAPMKVAMGLFAAYLPVECRITDEMDFGEALRLTAAAVREAAEYQDHFVWGHRAAGGNGEMEDSGEPALEGYLPFVFEAEHRRQAAAGDLRFEVQGIYSPIDRFRLRLRLEEAGDEAVLALAYDAACYDEGEARRLLSRLESLLAQIAARPSARVGELRALDDSERAGLLGSWSIAAASPVAAVDLYRLFAAQVERTPDAPAAVLGESLLTYGELDRRARSLAAELRRRSVGPEVRVVLVLERSLEQLIGQWAVLAAGGVFVPLDPAQPRRRLNRMVRDALAGIEQPIVLTQSTLVPSVSGEGRHVLCLDLELPRLAATEAAASPAPVSPDQAAYMIFTSGSTGRPNGTVITHRSVCNLAAMLAASVYGDENGGPRRFTLNAPLSFDSSVKQWVQLFAGHTLHVVPEEARPDGERFLSLLRRHRIDVLDATPSQLRLLLDAGLEETATHPLRVLLGGEAVDDALWQRLSGDSRRRYFNVYGPTECTVDTTTRRIDASAPRPTIGRPLGNVRVYVVDARLRLVPEGVAGELAIGGTGVARGYLDHAAQTAERFVPDPFGVDAGKRLYRSGDRVHWLPAATGAAGELAFLDRVDHQVKVRGGRVELGEIEAVLTEHVAIKEALVIAREDERGEVSLVAYVVPAGDTVEAAAIQTFLKESLPPSFLPSAVVVLERFPLTRNGKVDRRALPDPEERQRRRRLVAPRTPTEELLVDLFAELLPVAEVSADDDFFDLGGHSLLATRLLARARQAFGLEIPLRWLFDDASLASFATRIDGARRQGLGLERQPDIERRTSEGDLELSFSQQRMWFLSRLEPESPFYNAPAMVRLRGRLDASALFASFDHLVARHEIFRTAYPAVAGHAVARVLPSEPLAPPIIDLSGLPEDHRQRAEAAILTAELSRPFDLDAGRLLRLTLVRRQDEDHLALLTLHHLTTDAWSVGILVQEIAALYTAYCQGQSPTLPALPVQYSDFARWQRRWLDGEVLSTHLEYWKRHLAGELPSLDLPFDRDRPERPTRRGGRRVFGVAAELTESLRKLSRAEHATLFMTLLAAFKTFLLHETRQTDVIVGTAVANRSEKETEGLIGPFINMLALRTDLGGGPSFRQLLGRVREVTLGAYAHQELPFEKVVEELRPERRNDQAPIFQLAFGLQNSPVGTLALPDLELSALEFENEVARYDLTLWVSEVDGGLEAAWRYNRDVFDGATIERCHQRYATLLERIVEAPESRLQALHGPSAEEQAARAAKKQQRKDKNLRRFKAARRKRKMEISG